MDHGWFIHSMLEEHSDCFQSFAWIDIISAFQSGKLESSYCSAFLLSVGIIRVFFLSFYFSHSNRCVEVAYSDFNLHSVMSNNVEPFFISLFVIHMSALL